MLIFALYNKLTFARPNTRLNFLANWFIAKTNPGRAII
jgi:hypothetical protein